jgi:hypothetical protein
MIWGTYSTQQLCIQEQARFADDPVVGARMKAGKCVRSSKDDSGKDDSRSQLPD